MDNNESMNNQVNESNNIQQKTNNLNKIRIYLPMLGILVALIILCVLTVKMIKPLSYKEVEATLVSHDKPVASEAELEQHCNGKFKYNVNGIEYEANISIEYLYCTNGHKRIIYYDVNNPQIYADQKSIIPVIVLGVFDLFLIGGFVMEAMDLFCWRKSSRKKKSNNSDYKVKTMNNSTYGKYEIVYDATSFSNKYSGPDVRYLELSMKKTCLERSDGEFEICIPKELLNTFFETDVMNDVLYSYHELAKDNFEKIKKEFINQYNKSNSSIDEHDGLMLIDVIGTDKNAHISKLFCSCIYDDISYSFSYDIATRKVDDVDETS